MFFALNWNDPQLDALHDCGDAIAYPKLSDRIGEMEFNCLLGDRDDFSDLRALRTNRAERRRMSFVPFHLDDELIAHFYEQAAADAAVRTNGSDDVLHEFRNSR